MERFHSAFYHLPYWPWTFAPNDPGTNIEYQFESSLFATNFNRFSWYLAYLHNLFTLFECQEAFETISGNIRLWCIPLTFRNQKSMAIRSYCLLTWRMISSFCECKQNYSVLEKAFSWNLTIILFLQKFVPQPFKQHAFINANFIMRTNCVPFSVAC